MCFSFLFRIYPFVFSIQGRPGPKGDSGDTGLPGQKVSVVLEHSLSFLRVKWEDSLCRKAFATSLHELHVVHVKLLVNPWGRVEAELKQ